MGHGRLFQNRYLLVHYYLCIVFVAVIQFTFKLLLLKRLCPFIFSELSSY